MKKFTIPCNFGGTKSPFDVYIGNPKPGNHPLQNQAAWLSSERGGSIPPEVMESFAKLLDLSAKHGVSFEDLCVHAMKTVNQKGAAAPAAAPPASPAMAQNPPAVAPSIQKDKVEENKSAGIGGGSAPASITVQSSAPLPSPAPAPANDAPKTEAPAEKPQGSA